MPEKPNNVKVTLKNVRLSFPHIWTAKSVGGGEPRFSANFLMEKSDPAFKLAEQTVLNLMKGNFKSKLPMDKLPLRDGDTKEYDGYAGMFFVSAANKKRPGIVDRDRSPLIEEDSKPYAGCIVNAVVTFWVQNNNYGKRINASLEAIQFVRDGEAFGAAPVNTDKEFEDLGSDDSEASYDDDDDDDGLI